MAKVNGTLWDLDRPFESDATLELLTRFEDDEAKVSFGFLLCLLLILSNSYQPVFIIIMLFLEKSNTLQNIPSFYERST